MKIDMGKLYIATSRNGDPALYDNLEQALKDGVERQQDPSENPVKVGDYGGEDIIDSMLGYLEQNESQEVTVEKLTDHLNRFRENLCGDMPEYK